jgi:hypothetical protein
VPLAIPAQWAGEPPAYPTAEASRPPLAPRLHSSGMRPSVVGRTSRLLVVRGRHLDAVFKTAPFRALRHSAPHARGGRFRPFGLSRMRLFPAPRQASEDSGRDPGASGRDIASGQGRGVSIGRNRRAARWGWLAKGDPLRGCRRRTGRPVIGLRRGRPVVGFRPGRPLARASPRTGRRRRTCRPSSARVRCRARTPGTPPPADGEPKPPLS